MTRPGAVLGSLVFMIGQPGVMAGLIPWWVTGWQGREGPPVTQALGALLLVSGVSVLLETVIRFAVEGRGTPFPAAPTQHLVVGGLYRHVRNPMYLAVIAIILGQAAIFSNLVLLAYAGIFWAVVATFVRFYEEPKLLGTHGDQYAAYCRAVGPWVPRMKPWVE